MIVVYNISSICFHASVTYDLLWLFSWNIGDWSISHVDLSGSLCGWVRNYENVKCEISIKRPCSVLRKRKHSNAIKNVRRNTSALSRTPLSMKKQCLEFKNTFHASLRGWMLFSNDPTFKQSHTFTASSFPANLATATHTLFIPEDTRKVQSKCFTTQFLLNTYMHLYRADHKFWLECVLVFPDDTQISASIAPVQSRWWW